MEPIKFIIQVQKNIKRKEVYNKHFIMNFNGKLYTGNLDIDRGGDQSEFYVGNAEEIAKTSKFLKRFTQNRKISDFDVVSSNIFTRLNE